MNILTDRDTSRGQGRLPSRGNGRNDQDRNDFPPSVGRDIRLELPPEPARFTDWSSISSPPATFPHGMPGISAEPSENVSNQLNVQATGNQVKKPIMKSKMAKPQDKNKKMCCF